MTVDLPALTISLDSIFLTSIAVQVVLCVYLLIRSGPPLPSRAAIFTLLGGTTLQLASYATELAEDVQKTVVPYARMASTESFIFQLTESLLATLGYITILASFLVVLHQSGKGTKNERWMKRVVVGGSTILFFLLGLYIGSMVYTYVSNSQRSTRLTASEWADQLRAAAYIQRGITITVLILDGALVTLLAVGGLLNPVNRVHNAIFCGLIPTILVGITLSAISNGLYYSEQHIDILSDIGYIYSMNALSRATVVIIPACVLYAGYGWTSTDVSYTAGPSTEEMGEKF